MGVGQFLYIFGGRTGGTVSFGQEEDNLVSGESGALLAFDVLAERWELIDAPGPEARSFHTMAVVEDKVVVYGGCGAQGRLNDLWLFDPVLRAWSLLNDGKREGSPRAKGGSSLLPLHGIGGDLLLLFGFNGEQLGEVHHFNASAGTWLDVTHLQRGDVPSPRSVFASASRQAPGTSSPRAACEVFVLGGELEPSDQGHEGAGAFTDEIYTLTVGQSSGEGFDYTWQRCEAGGEGAHGLAGEARGWHASAVVEGGALGQHIVAFGGLTGDNRRLNETQVLPLPRR